jgi:RNA polymerase sigma factor (sigma-70 family)
MGATQPAQVFPETRWSLILRRPGARDGVGSQTALNELCRMYWQPLYGYLRRSGNQAEAAKDLVQGFLTHLLSRDGLARDHRTQCRFRYFLLASLRNYLVSEGRKQHAVKRGGGVDLVQLDLEQAEVVFQTQAAEPFTPEAGFDRQWAQTVWTRALQRLREEQRARGKERLFDALKPGLVDDLHPRHPEVAAALGLTAAAVALILHRLRRRLKALVIDELAQTVGSHGDLDDELNYFLSLWSK